MGTTEDILHLLGGGSQVAHATVLRVAEDGLVEVRGDAPGDERWCRVLVSGDAPARYAAGDDVLVLGARGAAEGLVLGRIGRATTSPAADPAAAADGAGARERRVVIAADEEIELRVGDASIRITADGKVAIRGEHVLSRAKGTNRIKGGSVAIN